jgi:hypothetical protein
LQAELGVLFVHGIGRQARGETLSACAAPLIEWLQGWLRPPDRVRVLRTTISAESLRDEPAHSLIEVDETEKGRQEKFYWRKAGGPRTFSLRATASSRAGFSRLEVGS